MNAVSPFPERLQRIFEPTDRGVVGLVDDLFNLCKEQSLQLEWKANQCRIHSLGAEPKEWSEIPLPKSVFRAALARVAALCNEFVPNSVSPFGGQGELAVCTNPPTVFCVVFTNTQSKQRLEVRRMPDDKIDGTDAASVGRKQSTQVNGACDESLD